MGDAPLRMFVEKAERALIGPHYRRERSAVQRNVPRIHNHTDRGDLKVIADESQDMEAFLFCDLFGR
jgi:hypothetical protein